jgi:hypothetical protein
MTTKILDSLYLDPHKPGSLGGVNRLFKEARKVLPTVSKEEVRKYLQGLESYTQQKPVRRKFRRRHVIATDRNDLYQFDLAFMLKFSKFNDGFMYLLTIVDCFSRYGFAIPLKSKNPKEIVLGLSIAFKEYGIPLKCQTDNGLEFKNSTVKKFLSDCGVVYYTTTNDDIKCALVERFNRTIKDRLWKHMTQENSFRYIDVLPAVIESYNYSVHSSTGFAPALVGVEESTTIRQKLLNERTENQATPSKLKIGDLVRLAKRKLTFEPGYESNFTEEIFVVDGVSKSENLSLYKVKDRSGEEVTGLFYDHELSKVVETAKSEHRISQILKTRKKNGVEEYLVRWYGYGPAYDSWEKKTDLQ